MKVTNLMPVRFSKKGKASLIAQLGIDELTESDERAYFDKATMDDNATVYFDESKQVFKIGAEFEMGSWSNNLRVISFDFADFECKAIELA